VFVFMDCLAGNLSEVYHKVKTMKIVTWIVNGVRAARGGWAWALDPDVRCLPSVKARPGQLQAKQAGRLRHPYVRI